MVILDRSRRRVQSAYAGGAALVAAGSGIIAVWNTAVGALLIGLGAVVGWLVATTRGLDELKATPRGSLPEQTITPAVGARIESGHHLGGDAGFGGGGGDGGGGGGAG